MIENVIDAQKVTELRSHLHAFVRDKHDVDYDALTLDSHAKLTVKPLNCYFSPFKLDAMLNQTLLDIFTALWRETLVARAPGFDHQHDDFDPTHAFAYLDRATFRLPDSLHPGKGLGLHVDMNPWDPMLQHSGGLKKWRPMQMSLALTDHLK